MKKPKICVISSYAYIKNNNNYGALLQYYAIEKFLTNKGFDVYWLRYTLPRTNYFFFLLHLIHREAIPSLFIKEIRCHKAFKKFCRMNINCSKTTYKSFSKLEKKVPAAEYYITGSDQVWGGSNQANFLRFVKDKEKKIAFAVSFGRKQLSKSQIDAGVPFWMQDFNNVSVREDTGVNICKDLGINAKLLLDPTFLLDKSDYLSLCKNDNKHTSPNIQGYFLNVNDKSDVFWDEIKLYADSKKLSLRITAVGNSGTKFPQKYCFYPSPEDWLYSYNSANYIVTNTFHGMVFAIIFRKQFAVFLLNGELSRMNTRITSLLERLGLTDRIWDGKTNFADLIEKPIDWTLTESIIKQNQDETILFLESAGLKCH